jgi:dienelactone hydrolase
MDEDPWVELDVASQLAETIETAELFLYRGNRHLFADASLPDYDEQSAALLMERVLGLLDTIE